MQIMPPQHRRAPVCVCVYVCLHCQGGGHRLGSDSFTKLSITARGVEGMWGRKGSSADYGLCNYVCVCALVCLYACVCVCLSV